MYETFSATLSVMLILLLCIIIGYILNKKKLVPENTATVLSKLETNVLCPALSISSFMTYCTVESITSQYVYILYCIAGTAILMPLAIWLARYFSKDKYTQNVYKYGLVFANNGFVGAFIIPLLLGGDATLYSYLLYTLPASIVINTWGVYILTPKTEKKVNVLKSLLNPMFIAVLIGAVLGLTGAKAYIPEFVTTTLSKCADCMAPLAMILTGFVIGNYDLKKMVTNVRVYVLALLRLIIMPALLIIIFRLVGGDVLVLKFTAVAFGAAIGLNTVVFPASFGGDTAPGASMALISHTLCVMSIPILFVFCDWICTVL